MKQERLIKGSISKCWEIVLDSLSKDYLSATGRAISTRKLKEGLTYKKNMKTRSGGANEATIEVVDLKPEELYRAEFTSSRGVNTLTYTFTPIDDDSFKLEYSEEFVSDKKLDNYNNTFMEFIFGLSLKKKVKNTLNQLEALVTS